MTESRTLATSSLASPAHGASMEIYHHRIYHWSFASIQAHIAAIADTTAIHEAMAFLCEHLPPALHLVLVTRSEPPLPLARMRARGELNEVRQIDLRFSLEESAFFLNQVMGLNLTTRDVAVLETRTEGWIASLQLAALSLKDASDPDQFIDGFTGTHRYIVDYLMEEVLAQRSEGTREFLLKTSVLSRFSAALCDELLSDDRSQQRLEELEAANFFLIPLDNERRWYRYHHLFADLLRQRAAEAYPDQIPRWYRKAARWYQTTDFPYDAIEMALSGSDHDHAALLILQAAETEIWAHGEWLLLERWLTDLPESTVKSRPRLCLYHAWGCLVRGKTAMCNARLADAESALLSNPAADPHAQGELAAIRASIARFQGNQAKVIAQPDRDSGSTHDRPSSPSPARAGSQASS